MAVLTRLSAPALRHASRSTPLAIGGAGTALTAVCASSFSLGSSASHRSPGTSIGFVIGGAGRTYGDASRNVGTCGHQLALVSSSSVLRLVATIHTNGNRKMPTPASSRRCAQPRVTKYRAIAPGGRITFAGAVMASGLFIVHPSAAQPQLDQRQRQHDQEQDPRQRAGVAHAEELERLAEQVVRVEQRRVDRPA